MQTTTQYVSGLQTDNKTPLKIAPRVWPDRVIPLLLFLFSVVYLLIFLRYSALEPDEGIVLQGAERILRGQLPYRDFFSFYTPGSYYLVALLFRIFGDSFAIARFSIVIVGALLPVMTYLTARRGCSREIALVTSLLTIVAGVAYRFLVLHNWYSTLLACLAVYAALRAIETHRPLWAFATGSLCSLTVLFEQSKGTGILVGLALGFLLQRLLQRRKLFRWPELAYAAIGFVWPLALVAGYFAWNHALVAMLRDWLWPLGHYGAVNHVAYGYQNWSDRSRDLIFHSGPAWATLVKVLVVSSGFIVPALPLVAVGSLACWTIWIWQGKVTAEKGAQHVVLSSDLTGLLLSVVLSRADIIHFMYLLPLWLVSLAWVLDANSSNGRLLASSRAGLMCFLTLSFGLMGLALLTTAAGARQITVTRRGWIRTRQTDPVIPYINAHHSSGTPLLVYPYLPLYYYLTDTQSVARLDYFQPGMNTAEQGEEIIAQLKAHPESSVLFEPSFLEKIGTSWPRTSVGVIAHDSIGNYIVHNYRVCQLLRTPSDALFEYLVSRERGCP